MPENQANQAIPMIDLTSISHVATGRESELFADDLAGCDEVLRDRIEGRRVLAVGAAGSIGASTVRALAAYRPRALHVIDQSENSLAELVRDLRSGSAPFEVEDFRALPLDYGAPVTFRFLRESGPYDLILNFAALKHVRSEKDVYSLVQMLDTNLVKQVRFLRWLAELDGEGRYFCVSTDKAANPVNLMGASKRAMEHLIFSRAVAPGLQVDVTSARFANVAFSDGSLLDGFLKRLQKQQPLAVPRETRRYFVSLREAGQICLLAAAVAPADHIVVPRLHAETDLRELESVAVALLAHVGLRARIYEEEEEAKASLQKDLSEGCYPLLVTPLDTSGEKPYEEFVGEGEEMVEIGLESVAAVPYRPVPPGKLTAFVELVESVVEGDTFPPKAEIISWIGDLIPNFQHVETWKHLDHRM